MNQPASSKGSRSGVLCAGSIVVDQGKLIDVYPAPERLTLIKGISASTGGPALNMAVNLRQLGADFPVALLGAVGDDQNGAFISTECERLGIEIGGLQILSSRATSFTDAMVERDGGRRTFFHHPGANASWMPSAAQVKASNARILHVGSPGLSPAMDAPVPGGGNGWSALLELAQQAGMHTNLELVTLGPDQMDAARPCLAHASSVIINELEAGELTGISAPGGAADRPVDWKALTRMASALIGLGVSEFAVVHFPAGCVAAAAGGQVWQQGSVRLRPAQVVSTTGAGDAFAAGVLFGWYAGWPLERCLRLGSASAAAGIASASTSGGIRPAQECLAEAERIGHRSAPA